MRHYRDLSTLVIRTMNSTHRQLHNSHYGERNGNADHQPAENNQSLAGQRRHSAQEQCIVSARHQHAAHAHQASPCESADPQATLMPRSQLK